MKTYQVILSGRATRSLKRILQYTRQTASDETALHIEQGLLEAIGKLATFPHSHSILQVSKKNITPKMETTGYNPAVAYILQS